MGLLWVSEDKIYQSNLKNIKEYKIKKNIKQMQATLLFTLKILFVWNQPTGEWIQGKAKALQRACVSSGHHMHLSVSD